MRVVEVFEEVKERQIATFVPDAYFTAFLVLVAADDVTLEEIVPAVTSFECTCVEKFNLLLLNGEQEVLSRLYQYHVYIVITLKAED